jgi:serine/threonine-protein kinase
LLNKTAWRLATSTDPALRDGPSALFFAVRAVAATSRTNANYLDTLAAAYAECGQFTNAVSVQREAIGLLKTDQEKQGYETRLKLYQSGSPVRE